MSRAIYIGYLNSENEERTAIQVPPPYFLLGNQTDSMQFWSAPQLKKAGISRLSQLGVMDPIYFRGWESIRELWLEICDLQRILPSINFDPEFKARWVSHLVYCYFLLIESTPKGSIPEVSIG